eukprot:766738-Hanusia_phi.AAC.1
MMIELERLKVTRKKRLLWREPDVKMTGCNDCSCASTRREWGDESSDINSYRSACAHRSKHTAEDEKVAAWTAHLAGPSALDQIKGCAQAQRCISEQHERRAGEGGEVTCWSNLLLRGFEVTEAEEHQRKLAR